MVSPSHVYADDEGGARQCPHGPVCIASSLQVAVVVR